uniref:Uncharacterized protein n=1 Tax=Timema genevievae TaxID=629358 RepID=A0A7R9JRH1_TIMGE|nr:unnamed protein product [Timema genevievae]
MIRKRRVQSVFATETEGNTDEREHTVSAHWVGTARTERTARTAHFRGVRPLSALTARMETKFAQLLLSQKVLLLSSSPIFFTDSSPPLLVHRVGKKEEGRGVYDGKARTSRETPSPVRDSPLPRVVASALPIHVLSTLPTAAQWFNGARNTQRDAPKALDEITKMVFFRENLVRILGGSDNLFLPWCEICGRVRLFRLMWSQVHEEPTYLRIDEKTDLYVFEITVNAIPPPRARKKCVNLILSGLLVVEHQLKGSGFDYCVQNISTRHSINGKGRLEEENEHERITLSNV